MRVDVCVCVRTIRSERVHIAYLVSVFVILKIKKVRNICYKRAVERLKWNRSY